MKIDRWDTVEIKEARIGLVDIIEKIEKSTTIKGTLIRYSTRFYDKCIEFCEIPLPMITNKSLDKIKTERGLRKILRTIL